MIFKALKLFIEQHFLQTLRRKFVESTKLGYTNSTLKVGAFLFLCFPLNLLSEPLKIIEYGWNVPTVKQMATLASTIDASPFDGLIFRVASMDHAFSCSTLDLELLNKELMILKNVRLPKLRHSFAILHSANISSMKWTSEQDWATILKNVKSLAEGLKWVGASGIAFDPEPYGRNPWLPTQGTMSLGVEQKNTFLRGRQFAQALHEGFPEIRVFLLFGASWFRPSTRGSDKGSVPDGYGLYADFLGGLVNGLDAKGALIDGCEQSFYFSNDVQFSRMRKETLTFGIPVLRSDIVQDYRNVATFSMALYLDRLLGIRDGSTWEGKSLDQKHQILRQVQSNLESALRYSDEYVWVYSERIDWWGTTQASGGQRTVPVEIQNTLANVGKSQNEFQP